MVSLQGPSIASSRKNLRPRRLLVLIKCVSASSVPLGPRCTKCPSLLLSRECHWDRHRECVDD
jgi:hypothetical protein